MITTASEPAGLPVAVRPRGARDLAGRTQVLGEPIRRRARSPLELVGVGGEVTAWIQLEPLGLVGPVERRQPEIGRADGVVVSEDHQQRRRRDPFDEGSRLVFGVELERSQGYLVAPLAKPPLILRRRGLPSEEVPRR